MPDFDSLHRHDGVLAVILRLQDRELKKKQKRRVWVSLLPSYQDMESLLFDMLMTGFVLLTLALSFGFSPSIISSPNI